MSLDRRWWRSKLDEGAQFQCRVEPSQLLQEGESVSRLPKRKCGSMNPSHEIIPAPLACESGPTAPATALCFRTSTLKAAAAEGTGPLGGPRAGDNASGHEGIDDDDGRRM
ncbi:MAG TPA: hypothetical protein VGD55_00550 [Acidothermaceae bacterium]